jgi:putative transposase
MNPVRAGLVERPAAYLWSSYRHYAHGDPDDLLTEHATIQALAWTPDRRQAAYRRFFDTPLRPELVQEFRNATRTGRALGTCGLPKNKGGRPRTRAKPRA